MQRLQAIDPETATGPTKQLLDGVQKKLGFTPNIMRTMANSPAVLQGYLNFSNGKPETKFRSNFHKFYATHCDVESSILPRLRSTLRKEIERLKKDSSAFRESSQAERVIDLALDRVPIAYRAFHKDLLFHLEAGDFEQTNR